MCGICGRFSIQAAPESPSPWQEMVASMVRRGPDGGGLVADAHCVMGARRLAVMDVSDRGALPMTSGDGRYVLAFNGELYNHQELRRALQLTGVVFRTTGDSEVVLEALRRWGTGALPRFNGMFALAFYDRVAREILLVRDHVGIKPLYVLTDSRGLVFASQFDQIMEHPWAHGRAVDTDAVSDYLRLGHIPATRAYLVGTEMLAAGTWMRMSGSGRITRSRYFSLGDLPDGPLPEQDEVDDVIHSAVRRQAIADVEVGSLLSGGVDSPLLSAMLSEVAGAARHSFTVRSADPRINESDDAARYASAIGSLHHEVLLDDATAATLLDDVLDATAEPLADAGIFPFMLASQAASEQVTVALSGEGGDELFWGYYPRQSAAIADPRDNYGLYFQHTAESQFQACFPTLTTWPSALPGPGVVGSGGEAGYERMRSYEVEQYLPFILLKADRASMHHSLEVRVPMLDIEVMRLARRLRAADCIDRDTGLGKLPLRRSLSRRVEFQTSAKRGFTAPVNQWIRGWMMHPVSDSVRELRGLGDIDVDSAAVARVFSDHQTGSVEAGVALFRLFMLDRWASKSRMSDSRWAPGEC